MNTLMQSALAPGASHRAFMAPGPGHVHLHVHLIVTRVRDYVTCLTDFDARRHGEYSDAEV